HAPETDFGRLLQVPGELGDSPDAAATLANLYSYASERHQPRPRLSDDRLPIGEPSSGDIPRGPTFDALDPRGPLRAGAVDQRQSVGPYLDPIERTRFAAPPAGTDVRVVLRGVYSGNWNPEPAADLVLAERLAAERGIRVLFRDVRLDQPGELALIAHREPNALLWIRGTDPAHLPHAAGGDLRPEAWAAVRQFAEAGSVVFIENVGGLSDFGRDAERMLRAWWPESRFRRAVRDRVITGDGLDGAVDLQRVEYRLFSITELGNREQRPRLRGLESARRRPLIDPDVNGSGDTSGDGAAVEPATAAVRVYVSRDDLSHAMLHQPVWGVSGYAAADAIDLVGNLIAEAHHGGSAGE
ncbi:MAG: hypothetical protein ACOC0P_01705, partial [Planctomycetota bacterium]